MTAKELIDGVWYEQGTDEYFEALAEEFKPKYDDTPTIPTEQIYDDTPTIPTEQILVRQFWNYPNRGALPIAAVLAGLPKE